MKNYERDSMNCYLSNFSKWMRIKIFTIRLKYFKTRTYSAIFSIKETVSFVYYQMFYKKSICEIKNYHLWDRFNNLCITKFVKISISAVRSNKFWERYNNIWFM